MLSDRYRHFSRNSFIHTKLLWTLCSSFRPRSLRTTDAFPVVASFPPKDRKCVCCSQAIDHADSQHCGQQGWWPTVMGVVASVRFLFVRLLGIFSNLTHNKVYKSASQRPLLEAEYYTCNDSLKWDDGIHFHHIWPA